MPSKQGDSLVRPPFVPPLVRRLHPALNQQGGPPAFIPQPLIPQLRLVAHQVLDCPLTGSARRFFMEAKALETLSLQIGAFSSSSLRKAAKLNKADRERLEEARRILEAEYADPPSLLALAHRIGLNDFKLKRGFRDIYQTTVFGYVRMLRMAKALAMLQTGDMYVSEVASTVGYTCFGHFSVAFRRQFGIAPSDERKSRNLRTGFGEAALTDK